MMVLAAQIEESFDAVTAWIGIITGISGVVLSIVAIMFAFFVQRDANAVTRQTIDSIKRIEADVDKLSSETSQLIKAAWDRMIENSIRSDAVLANRYVDAVVANADGDDEPPDGPPTPGGGLSNGSSDGGSKEQYPESMRDLLIALQESVKASHVRPKYDQDEVSRLRKRIERGGPIAVELLRLIASNKHLTNEQFRQLQKFSGIGEALRRLADQKLITPALSQDPNDPDATVWWTNPDISLLDLNTALLLAQSTGVDRNTVYNALSRVGYDYTEPKRGTAS